VAHRSGARGSFVWVFKRPPLNRVCRLPKHEHLCCGFSAPIAANAIARLWRAIDTTSPTQQLNHVLTHTLWSPRRDMLTRAQKRRLEEQQTADEAAPNTSDDGEEELEDREKSTSDNSDDDVAVAIDAEAETPRGPKLLRFVPDTSCAQPCIGGRRRGRDAPRPKKLQLKSCTSP